MRRLTELDFRPTPMGDLVLRRRVDPLSGVEVHEVKLGDEYLMSSLFTEAEEQLAHLAMAELGTPPGDGPGFEVLVGGLGLGYTARAVLAHPEVATMVVVDALEAVIDWHRQGLVPLGPGLTADPRCRLAHGDFFALAVGDGPDPDQPGRAFDALVVDIDHSPRHVLHPSHAALYEPAGLARLAEHLRPGGVFALWSNDPPDADFLAALGGPFTQVRAEVVTFPNPIQGGSSTNSVYLARI